MSVKLDFNVEDFAGGEVLDHKLIESFEFKDEKKYTFDELRNLYGPVTFAHFIVHLLEQICHIKLPTYIDEDGIECFKPLKLTDGKIFKIKVDDNGSPIDAIAWFPQKKGR